MAISQDVYLAAAMPRIVSACVSVVEYNLGGYKLSYGTIDKIKSIVLRLIDADGTTGWGEANPQQPFTEESAEDVSAVLREELLPLVLKQESPAPVYVDTILDQYRSDHLIAKGAISMALLDIQGKRQGVPVAKLLGTVVHESLPVLWPFSQQSVEQDIVQIDQKRRQGFKTFMLKMGQRDADSNANVRNEAARIRTLKDRYGDDVTLIADANTGWTVEETEDFLRNIKTFDIAFLEQPTDKVDTSQMAQLAQRFPDIPLSADESLTSPEQAERLISTKASSVFSIKSSKNGGPLRAKAICERADRHGVKLYMNSMLELGITQAASLQLAVTRSNLVDAGHAYMSTLRLDGDPTNFSSFIEDGIVRLPDAPGLGIEVDEEKLQKLVVDEYILGK